MKNRLTPSKRNEYKLFRPIQTRWEDMDIYGHINNVVYLSWFDTAINGWYLDEGLLRLGAPKVFVVAKTEAHYFKDVKLTQKVECGIRVIRLGNSSVTYDVGVFADKGRVCNARGFYTHVLVDNKKRTPVKIDGKRRKSLKAIM